MSLNINLHNKKHLCPHSHAWYSSDKIYLLGTLLLLLPVSWQLFIGGYLHSPFLTSPLFLRMTLGWLLSFLLELLASVICKRPTYLDARFLFYTLILVISLPLSLAANVVFLAIGFSYLLNRIVFNGRGCVFPFVSSGYAFAFLSSPENFLSVVSRPTLEPALQMMIQKFHLDAPGLAWLSNFSAETLNTFAIGYCIIAVVLYMLKAVNMRIALSATCVYIIGQILLGVNIFKYPQTLFCLLIVSGDTQVSPFSNFGKIILGVMIGLMTLILQIFWVPHISGYFAILFSSLFSPIINNMIRPILLRTTRKKHEVLL